MWRDIASVVSLLCVQTVLNPLDPDPNSEREKAWVRKVRAEREKYVHRTSDHISLLRLFSKFKDFTSEEVSKRKEVKQWGRSLNLNLRELQEAHNISMQLQTAIE